MILNTTNRPRLALALATLLLTFPGGSAITRAEGCTIPPRFGPLVREIPQVVGQCLLNPTSDPSTGDIGQVTTNGELLMRGSDGIAQFTDATNGYLTWVAGPDGVVSRSQDERFEWEAPLASPADAGPAQTIDNENDNLNASELANTNTVDASGGNATGGNANAQGGNSSNANTNNVNPVINVNVIMPGAPASTPTPAILPSPISATPMPAVPTATIALTNLAPPVNAGPSAQAGQWVAWGTGWRTGSPWPKGPELCGPGVIQVAKDGTIYVLDVCKGEYSQNNNSRSLIENRVVKLMPTDGCQCWWDAERAIPTPPFTDLQGPSREFFRRESHVITLDNKQNLLVLKSNYNESVNRILIGTLNSKLELMQVPWSLAFDRIMDMAVDQFGSIYAITRTQIVKLGMDGKEISRWGGPGTGPGQFNGLSAIALDGQGNVYVADRENNRIQKLSANGGKPIAQFGTKGDGPGQFDFPAGIAVDQQGNLWVADTGNNRIQKLSSSGQFIQAWGNTGPFGTQMLPGDQPGQFNLPSDLKIDAKGNLYVADYGNHRIQKLTVNP